ncbi:MAG: pentapeptide repeat-containing protein, partial [Candidatus Promineifilaceae bacterium]
LTYHIPSMKRIDLQPMTEMQIEEYLKKRIPLIQHENVPTDWKFYQEQINKVIGLKSLAKRPVLLEITISALPILIQKGGSVTRSRLYETYLEGEIDRQQLVKQRTFLIGSKERLRFIRKVAEYMYINNRSEITGKQIQAVLKDELSSSQVGYLESRLRDFISVSFMTREGDLYRFSHLSFMEYLVAKSIASQISMKQKTLLQTRKINEAISGFLIEFADENPSWTENLYGLIEATKQSAKEVAQYVGANAISLLKEFEGDFEEKDFSGTVLVSADFSSCNCSNTNFSNAMLNDADFTNTKLFNSNFRDAVLENSRFGNNEFDKGILNGQVLKNYIKSSDTFTGAVSTNVVIEEDIAEHIKKLEALLSNMDKNELTSQFKLEFKARIEEWKSSGSFNLALQELWVHKTTNRSSLSESKLTLRFLEHLLLHVAAIEE